MQNKTFPATFNSVRWRCKPCRMHCSQFQTTKQTVPMALQDLSSALQAVPSGKQAVQNALQDVSAALQDEQNVLQ